MIENKELWFVEFPTYRYTQDVKVLARKAGLKIVDARFKDEMDMTQAPTAPKLTLKKQYAPVVAQVENSTPDPQMVVQPTIAQ